MSILAALSQRLRHQAAHVAAALIIALSLHGTAHAGFNVQLDYGASGSSQSTTGTMSASSTSLTLAAAIDFANGQGISITHAGAANTAGVPTSPSAALPAWPGAFLPVPYNASGAGHQYLIKPTSNNAGNNVYEISAVTSSTGSGYTNGTEPNWVTSCSAANSTCVDYGLTWAQHTASYTTTFTYQLAAFDSNGGVSAATSAFTCTTAPSALNELTPCIVKWTPGTNDVGVLVYRNNALIGVAPASDGIFYDEGFTGANGAYWPDFPTSPPASPLAGRLVTTIASGAGTTVLTLANAAITTASAQAVNHDDTVAMQAWANTLLATNGSKGDCPKGTYQLTSTLQFVATSGIAVHIKGPSENEDLTGCSLIYNGDPNKAAVYTNGLGFSQFDSMTISANSIAIYGLQVDNSDGAHPASSDNWNRLAVLYPSNSPHAAGIEFGHPGMGAWEVSEQRVTDSFVFAPFPSSQGAGIREEVAAGNLKNYWFTRNEVGEFDTGYDIGGSGTTTIIGGTIGNGTHTAILARGNGGKITVSGTEEEDDPLTGSHFLIENNSTAAEITAIVLQGNSWESATWTDDTVVKGAGLVLTGNSFFNYRSATSVAGVETDIADATVGVASGGIVSTYNWYANVPSPYFPPFYDFGGTHLSDLANDYAGIHGVATPLYSLGDKTLTGGGTSTNLVNINGYGGDHILTRLFGVGKPGALILDSNSGNPILENLSIIKLRNLLLSATPPTISSGFGSTPSVPSNNGTGAFTVNVGTGGTASTGVIGLPAATAGWVCHCDDLTTKTAAVFITKQTASATNSCTVRNFNTSGTAVAWASGDLLSCSASAY